jgi:hypothetical protein
MMDFGELRRILAALEREGVRYVLVGSMAMAAQGIVRATRDADFFVAPDEQNVKRLRRALKSLFDDDPNVDEITAADLGGDIRLSSTRRLTGVIRWTSSRASGRRLATRSSKRRT